MRGVSVDLRLGRAEKVIPYVPAGSFEVVVTDPPYGIDGGRGGNVKRGKGKYNMVGWEDTEQYIGDVVVPLLMSLRKDARCVVVTPGHTNLHLYPKADDMGCFWTPAAVGRGAWGFSTFNPILYYGRDYRAGKGSLPNGIQVTERANVEGHPCPKPLHAWTWLVKKASMEGETVLDPFMGSGTTGVACVNTGRNFIGIELDPDYYELAQRRIEKAQTLGRQYEMSLVEASA
jgi:DNA modification methylase